MIKTKITDYVDDVIAGTVVLAGTGCAVYITYKTGSIPEFFMMGFGMILAHFFEKSKRV